MLKTINEKFKTDQAREGDLHYKMPVYLTNGCCEPAWSCPAQFDKLGLDFRRQVVHDHAYEGWGFSDPLTTAENEYIAEDFVKTEVGEAILAYTVLYLGAKWLFPNVEICFDGPNRTFSKESYGDQFAKSARAGKKLALELAAKIDPKWDVIFLPNVELDRHSFGILVPFEFAHAQGTYDNYKECVADLFNGSRKYRQAKPK